MFGPRRYGRRGNVRVYGCSPGCLLLSLAVSLALSLVLTVLVNGCAALAG